MVAPDVFVVFVGVFSFQKKMPWSERFIRRMLEMAHFSAKNRLPIGVVRLCKILHAINGVVEITGTFFAEKRNFSGASHLLSGIHVLLSVCMFEHPPVANHPTTPLYSTRYLSFMTNRREYAQCMRRALMYLCLTHVRHTIGYRRCTKEEKRETARAAAAPRQ